MNYFLLEQDTEIGYGDLELCWNDAFIYMIASKGIKISKYPVS